MEETNFDFFPSGGDQFWFIFRMEAINPCLFSSGDEFWFIFSSEGDKF